MSVILPEEALELLNRLTIHRGNRLNGRRGRRDPYSLFDFPAIAGLCDMIESIPRVLLPNDAYAYRQFMLGRASLRTTLAAWAHNEPVAFDLVAARAKRYPLWLIRSALDAAIEERREKYRRASVGFAKELHAARLIRTTDTAIQTAVTPNCDSRCGNLTFGARET